MSTLLTPPSAYLFSLVANNIADNTPIPIGSVGSNNLFTGGPAIWTLEESGTFLITFNTNCEATSAIFSSVLLFVNGALAAPAFYSRSNLAANTTGVLTATGVLSLTTGSTMQLQNGTGVPVNFANTTLSVVRLL